jgi:hypothetical protein
MGESLDRLGSPGLTDENGFSPRGLVHDAVTKGNPAIDGAP